MASRTYVDSLGNVCRRLTLPAGRSIIRFDAHADVTPDADGVDTGAEEVAPEAPAGCRRVLHVAQPVLPVR